jgi:hypothetical protein
MVTWVINNRLRVGFERASHAIQGVPLFPLIINTIHRQDVNHLIDLQDFGVILQRVEVAPQDGFRFQTVVGSNAEQIIPQLDCICDYLVARPARDDRQGIGMSGDTLILGGWWRNWNECRKLAPRLNQVSLRGGPPRPGDPRRRKTFVYAS